MHNKIRWGIVGLVLACWAPQLINFASSAVWQWSKTASSNASADPSINWREGQPPSSVNDSARAMMAAVAQYSADIAGAVLTTGSSTAYALATNSAFTGETLAGLDGKSVAFTVHTTNGATVTLNVDGLGAQPLRSAPAAEIAAGTLVQGSPYSAIYNNSDGAWYLRNFYSSGVTVPIGALVPYTGRTSPNASFILPAGQAISRTTYATYFALVSTSFGTGDGVTTFNVPDLRGRTIAGLDNLNGTPAARITVAGGNFDGTLLGSTGVGGLQNHLLSILEMPAHNHTITDPGHTHTWTSAASNQPINTNPGSVYANSGSSPPGPTSTSSAMTGINATNNAGGGTAFTVLPPVMTLGYLLRVL